MSTLNRRQIKLVIVWDKDAPNDFTWVVHTTAFVTDDTKVGGEERVTVRSQPQTITRTTFRGLTGAQIETNAKAQSDTDLQNLGQGGHTAVDDTGS